MEKKLSDYLHLYLGCDAILNNNQLEIVKVEAISQRMGVYDAFLMGRNSGSWYSLLAIKIILRQLSDMTEDEAYELEMLGHELVIKRVESNEFYAHRTKHLLSKHFDLFGLIESGLAIAKSTINQPLAGG